MKVVTKRMPLARKQTSTQAMMRAIQTSFDVLSFMVTSNVIHCSKKMDGSNRPNVIWLNEKAVYIDCLFY
jgi:hypothetical protein